jgi:hypothetical protein
MNDLNCTAEIYSMLREYIPINQLSRVAEEVVAVMMDEGYNLDQIEQAMSEHDEMYDAIEDATEYGESGDIDDYMIDDEEDQDYMEKE